MSTKISSGSEFIGRALIVSHTHWDREWYLSQRQFQFLLGDTLDDILNTLKSDSAFICFTADGQTSIIEDYLEVRPDRKEDLLQLIKSGKIRVGPWYTMPDLWLPDGESIIRNLLIGRHDCAHLGVDQPNLGYVPDSFGHIEQMPQILNGFGIDNYIFSRGQPKESLNGALEFTWQGVDGQSSVTAHILPGGYQNGMMLPNVTKTQQLRNSLDRCLEPYKDRSAQPGLALICNGVDHIWIQRDLPIILAEANRLYPTVEFILGDFTDYIKLFDQRSPKLPLRRGTLQGRHWTSGMLHGTWSSRIDTKLENARSIMTLENWGEPMAALLAVQKGTAHRQQELLLAWRLLLQNHAHDSICGCSIDRVHREVSRRFVQVQEIGEMIAGDALIRWNNALSGSLLPRLIIFSGLAGSNGIVEFIIDRTSDAPFGISDLDGNVFPIQHVSCRRLSRTDVVELRDEQMSEGDNSIRNLEFSEYRAIALLPKLSPCSLNAYTIVDHPSIATVVDQVVVTEHSLENALLRVEANRDGSLSVLHKPTGRLYEGLFVLSDEADLGGGYMFIPNESESVRRSSECTAHTSIVENGPLRGCIRANIIWPLPTSLEKGRTRRTSTETLCEWSMDIRLESRSEMVQVRGVFNNRAEEHRVRLTLPMPFPARTANVERAFVVANEEMDTYISDLGQHSHAMRNWVAIGDEIGGLSFVGKGLHEWSLENDTLSVTILRSVPFVYTCGSWETPDGLMLGEFEFDCCLIFFSGTWRDGNVAQRAAQFIQPTVAEAFQPSCPSWSSEPHASIALKEIASSHSYDVSSNRTTWRRHFANRDGWRREEPVEMKSMEAVPISPINWDDSEILLSAFKLAGSPKGTTDLIVRLYSLAEKLRNVSLSFGIPVIAVFRSDLAETSKLPIELEEGSINLTIKPFEIVTLRLVTHLERVSP